MRQGLEEQSPSQCKRRSVCDHSNVCSGSSGDTGITQLYNIAVYARPSRPGFGSSKQIHGEKHSHITMNFHTSASQNENEMGTFRSLIPRMEKPGSWHLLSITSQLDPSLSASLSQCLEGVWANTQWTQGNASGLRQKAGLLWLIFLSAKVITKQVSQTVMDSACSLADVWFQLFFMWELLITRNWQKHAPKIPFSVSLAISKGKKLHWMIFVNRKTSPSYKGDLILWKK